MEGRKGVKLVFAGVNEQVNFPIQLALEGDYFKSRGKINIYNA